jgi:hypothetical protein
MALNYGLFSMKKDYIIGPRASKTAGRQTNGPRARINSSVYLFRSIY